MNRRRFISGMSTTALLAMLGENLIALPAFASTTRKKKFVLIKLEGGWDVTQSLDPKTHADGTTQEDLFLEYGDSEIIDVNGVRLGPAAASLKPFADGLAIVNGVAMAASDPGHTAGLTYMSTGNGAGHSPDLPVEIAYGGEAGLLGVVTNSVLSVLARKVTVTTTQSMADSGLAVDPAAYSGFLGRLGGRGAFTAAALAGASDPTTQKALANEIANRRAALSAITSRGLDFNQLSLATSAQYLAAAFAAGASSHGQISTSFNLDSHNNHPGAHMAEQTKAWNSVADLFATFKATPGQNGSLWDDTLFMVISEFARTPALNVSKGKDHNPLTNSVLLAGGLVRPGVYGGSTIVKRSERVEGNSVHAGLPMDFATGEIAMTRARASQANFRYVQPEHVVNTVAQIMDVDRRKFQSVAAEAPILSRILR